MFQQLSFSYYGRRNNDLYDFGNPGFWGVINIIEYIWGIKFLKDSCNFNITQLSLYFQEMQSIGIGSKVLINLQKMLLDGLIYLNITGDQSL